MDRLLLRIIEDLETVRAQLIVDGREGYANQVRLDIENLAWLYKELTDYEG